MPEERQARFNIIAIVGAALAAIGLTMILVSEEMIEDAEYEYLTTDMTDEEFYDIVDSLDLVWDAGLAIIGISIITVALSVPSISASAFERMKKRLEMDLYRKCPACGSWNTKLAANCATCGILMPKVQEQPPVEVGQGVMKGPP